MLGSIEERLLVPTYASRWTVAPVVAHRSMALPFQLTGPVRRRNLVVGGEPVELLEAGREKLVRPLAARLFGELPQPVHQVRRSLWSPAGLMESRADIVVTEVHRWLAPRFRRAGWLTVPQSVRWHGAISAIPPKDRSHGLRDNMRKLRKHGFSIEQGTGERDWQEFYHTMVGPQALVRHGANAWIPSTALMAEFARHGVLQFITRRGERVAGMCMVGRGDTLWFALSGVRNGDPELLRQGAGFAILALSVEWARSQGYQFIDAGRTSPFTNDGVQQIKRKFGLAPVTDPLAHLAAVWVNSDIVRKAFSQEPVMVENGSGLRIYAGE
jgi:hypothetical protein